MPRIRSFARSPRLAPLCLSSLSSSATAESSSSSRSVDVRSPRPSRVAPSHARRARQPPPAARQAARLRLSACCFLLELGRDLGNLRLALEMLSRCADGLPQLQRRRPYHGCDCDEALHSWSRLVDSDAIKGHTRQLQLGISRHASRIGTCVRGIKSRMRSVTKSVIFIFILCT
jgi:hypothetical protein